MESLCLLVVKLHGEIGGEDIGDELGGEKLYCLRHMFMSGEPMVIARWETLRYGRGERLNP